MRTVLVTVSLVCTRMAKVFWWGIISSILVG